MKNDKEFDCVKMKCDIQQQLLNEYSEMEPEQARRMQRQRIESDPVIGPFLQQIAVPDALKSQP